LSSADLHSFIYCSENDFFPVFIVSKSFYKLLKGPMSNNSFVTSTELHLPSPRYFDSGMASRLQH
jgi:hypothetical protein